jgi:hypothetical protein
MVLVPFPMLQSVVLAGSLLAGLPWLRSDSAVPKENGPEPAASSHVAGSPNRVVLYAADAAEYRALAIPKSYKSHPEATLHLLVFRDGLCIRDRGLVQIQETGGGGEAGKLVMEETGVTERAFVAADGRGAVIAKTRYVSRVDLTPGKTSAADDTVKSVTTLTLIDPRHPDGLWQVTIEDGRWVKDLLVLPASMGVAITTFLPRTGPADLRILDADGRETTHVPESSGEAIRLEAASGGYVAAEFAFPDDASVWECGVVVFDLAHGTQWTYGWRYGGGTEPTSWTLQDRGVLAVKLAKGTQRFDAAGRRL